MNSTCLISKSANGPLLVFKNVVSELYLVRSLRITTKAVLKTPTLDFDTNAIPTRTYVPVAVGPGGATALVVGVKAPISHQLTPFVEIGYMEASVSTKKTPFLPQSQ
jgi:hypothetical protein